MKSLLKSAPILLALALTAMPAVAGQELTLQPGSKLWLTGSSTVHDYSSTASKLDVTFEIATEKWNPALAQGEAIERLIRDHGVISIQAVVGVAGMSSGKKGLDKNMRKALLADQHPKIRFEMKEYQVADGATTGDLTIKGKGKLIVAGVERDADISVTARREGDFVRLHADVPLLMTQFKIKPPTMMMGTLKTSDQITVHFDLKVGTAAGKAEAAVSTP